VPLRRRTCGIGLAFSDDEEEEIGLSVHQRHRFKRPASAPPILIIIKPHVYSASSYSSTINSIDSN
jgi:hypothetical protein